MDDWHKIYVTDCTGKKFFQTLASPMSTASEIKNLKKHIEQAKNNPKAYHFFDVDTAVIMLDGSIYGEVDSALDTDALLAELGL